MAKLSQDKTTGTVTKSNLMFVMIVCLSLSYYLLTNQNKLKSTVTYLSTADESHFERHKELYSRIVDLEYAQMAVEQELMVLYTTSASKDAVKSLLELNKAFYQELMKLKKEIDK